MIVLIDGKRGIVNANVHRDVKVFRHLADGQRAVSAVLNVLHAVDLHTPQITDIAIAKLVLVECEADGERTALGLFQVGLDKYLLVIHVCVVIVRRDVYQAVFRSAGVLLDDVLEAFPEVKVHVFVFLPLRHVQRAEKERGRRENRAIALVQLVGAQIDIFKTVAADEGLAADCL